LGKKRTFIYLAIGQLAALTFGFWAMDRFTTASSAQRSHAEADDHLGANHADGANTPASAETPPAHLDFAALGIAWLWIAALQTTFAYLLLAKMHGRDHEATVANIRQLMQRESDLVRTRNAVIFGLAKLAEYRDSDTGQHLERISLYSTCLANALRSLPEYQSQVTAAFVKNIGISSALHDIGKVAIDDAILCKAGRLTDKERNRMQDHAAIGAKCIQQIEYRLGKSNFLQMAREIAHCHHERWDGGGYPTGLAGTAIPLSARIVAIADVYDALASQRVYKNAYVHEKCVEIIRSEAGTHFDPNLVTVFLKLERQFASIARQHRDQEIAHGGDGADEPEEAADSRSTRRFELTDSNQSSDLPEAAPPTNRTTSGDQSPSDLESPAQCL
jgi:HD-GYP domain-containing protein (c-di-GMP phosphodiesterase class II)